MSRRSKKTPIWNEEIARNVVKDYASGIATEDIAQIYRVPEKTVVHYLSQYGQLFRNAGVYRDEEYIVQARILQVLAEGRDPHTGEQLPAEILGQPEILRALSAGAEALMAQGLPARTGKPWKPAEEERLLKMKAGGMSNAAVAKKLRRSERAVEYKTEELADRAVHSHSEEEKKAAMQHVRLRPKPDAKAWSEEELRKLRDMSQSGMDVLNIAAYFGRSVEETQLAMERLQTK